MRRRSLRLESLEQRQFLDANVTGIEFAKDDGWEVLYLDAEYPFELTYLLTYDTDAMSGTAYNVTITESVPAGCTLSSVTESLSDIWVPQGDGTYVQTIGDVEAGEGEWMAVPFIVDVPYSTTLTSITNTAILRSDNGDIVTAVDTDEVYQEATSPLSIEKDDGVTAVSAGQTLTYAITYSTASDATGVVIEETLPDDTTYVGSDDDGDWQLVGGVYQLNVGELLASAGEVTTYFTVQVVADPSGTTVDNMVTISDDADNTNTDTDSDTILAASTLIVTKDDGVTAAAPGDTLTYTIGYTNSGESSVSGVVLTETLPAGTTFNAAESAAGWSLSGSTLTYSLGTLAAGATGSVALALDVDDIVPAGLESIVNTVAISGGGNTDTATDTDALEAAPQFVISKSDDETEAAPGDVLVYVVEYSNTGDQDAAGVTLIETLPAGAVFNSDESSAGWTDYGSGTYVYTVGALAGNGGSGSVVFAVTVGSAQAAGQTHIVNTVMIADDGNLSETATDSDTLNAAPDLAVTKTDNLTQIGAGQTVAYTIGYSNVGTRGASGVVLTDTLPANLAFNSADNAGWTQSGSTLTYAVGVVEVGESGSVTLILTVDSAAVVGDTVTNSVNIADDGANGEDPDATNNSAEDTDEVSGVDLSIAKVVSAPVAIAGQAMVYTITVTNVGAGAASGVVVTDVLPSQTVFVAATAPDGFTITAPEAGLCGTVTFSADTLAGGESVTLTIVVQTSASLANGQRFANTATVASSATDTNPADNTATSGSTYVCQRGVGVRISSVDPTLTDLIIGGSDSPDIIIVSANSSGRLTVYMNGASYGPYVITGRIVAYGRGGIDRIYVNSSVTCRAMLFGGAGRDLLYAGSGDTVLVGGDDNDYLAAGAGNNILIGGRGADYLKGTLGNNILIGGSSVHDAHEVALSALLDEWSSDLPYWKRVRHINNGGPGILPGPLNGSYYFNNRTLIDDNAYDVLRGGSGADFFLSHSLGGGTYDCLIGLVENAEWLRYY